MKLLPVLLISLMLVLNVSPLQAGEKIVIDGSTTVGPIAKAFAEYYMSLNKDVNITVSESGSGNGAKSLINSTCDVADMSRFMKDKEFKAAAEKNVKPTFHVVALDGLPILVHPANPVKQLTVEQVRNIYMGKITNWNQVGGPDKMIIVVVREEGSGTRAAFEELVMGKEAQITDAAILLPSNGAVRTTVSTTPDAVGFLSFGYLDESVKALKVGGISPTAANASNGTYPVVRPLNMMTKGAPSAAVKAWFDYILSADGQAIVADEGYIAVK